MQVYGKQPHGTGNGRIHGEAKEKFTCLSEVVLFLSMMRRAVSVRGKFERYGDE